MMNQIPTAAILVAYCQQDEQQLIAFKELAGKSSERLDQPVVACPLDQPERPLLHAITSLLQQGTVKIVILPLFLSPAEYQDNAIADAVAFAGRRWPHAHFHLSPPPTWSEWLQVLSTDLRAPDLGESTVILVGQGSHDPAVNSDLSKLARLLYEKHAFARVDTAFFANTTPTVAETFARHQALGARHTTILPTFLFKGAPYEQLLNQLEAARSHSQLTIASCTQFSHSQLTIAPCLSSSRSLIDLLQTLHHAALSDRSLLPVNWEIVQRELISEMEAEHKQRPGQSAADEAAFQRVLTKIDEILPPRIRGQANPTGNGRSTAANLPFDDEGAVLWDQLFDPADASVDSALAGGASHREELLETVSPDDCLAEPEKYRAVLAEIGKGIQIVTGLPIVESKAPGWIGVGCASAEMAIWLVRAIIVENVMVRREGDVLYLPAGPHFTLEDEIMSIVAVVAKSWRFWDERVAAGQGNSANADNGMSKEISMNGSLTSAT